MRTYWVHADSRKMTRPLVALKVHGAAGARDEALFDLSGGMTPRRHLEARFKPLNAQMMLRSC